MLSSQKRIAAKVDEYEEDTITLEDENSSDFYEETEVEINDYEDEDESSDNSLENIVVTVDGNDYEIDPMLVSDSAILMISRIITETQELSNFPSPPEMSRLWWDLTVVALEVCVDIPPDVASCRIIYYPNPDPTKKDGVAYDGKKLRWQIEDIVAFYYHLVKAYHQSRPERIERFIELHSREIPKKHKQQLLSSARSDRQMANELNKSITSDIVSFFLTANGRSQTSIEETRQVIQKPIPPKRQSSLTRNNGRKQRRTR